jgi:hypothetical protein
LVDLQYLNDDMTLPSSLYCGVGFPPDGKLLPSICRLWELQNGGGLLPPDCELLFRSAAAGGTGWVFEALYPELNIA